MLDRIGADILTRRTGQCTRKHSPRRIGELEAGGRNRKGRITLTECFLASPGHVERCRRDRQCPAVHRADAVVGGRGQRALGNGIVRHIFACRAHRRTGHCNRHGLTVDEARHPEAERRVSAAINLVHAVQGQHQRRARDSDQAVGIAGSRQHIITGIGPGQAGHRRGIGPNARRRSQHDRCILGIGHTDHRRDDVSALHPGQRYRANGRRRAIDIGGVGHRIIDGEAKLRRIDRERPRRESQRIIAGRCQGAERDRIGTGILTRCARQRSGQRIASGIG